MPREIEKAFEEEYGKKKGRLIFYKWRAKHKKHDKELHRKMLKF